MIFLKKYKYQIFITLFFVFAGYYFLKDIYDTGKLDKEGEYIKGRVVQIIDLPRFRNELRYVFYINGVKYSGKRSLKFSSRTKAIYGIEGSLVTIIYLPSNPKVNRLYMKDW